MAEGLIEVFRDQPVRPEENKLRDLEDRVAALERLVKVLAEKVSG